MEDPESGVRAVVKDLRREWVSRPPRTSPRSSAACRRVEIFYFTWGVMTRGIQANVRLDDERAAVLAALTGDESIKGKKKVTLTAKHLFTLVRFVGVGWDLLRWCASTPRGVAGFSVHHNP